MIDDLPYIDGLQQPDPPLTLEELREAMELMGPLDPPGEEIHLNKLRRAVLELIALREGKTVGGKFLASFGPEVVREFPAAQAEEGGCPSTK